MERLDQMDFLCNGSWPPHPSDKSSWQSLLLMWDLPCNQCWRFLQWFLSHWLVASWLGSSIYASKQCLNKKCFIKCYRCKMSAFKNLRGYRNFHSPWDRSPSLVAPAIRGEYFYLYLLIFLVQKYSICSVSCRNVGNVGCWQLVSNASQALSSADPLPVDPLPIDWLF